MKSHAKDIDGQLVRIGDTVCKVEYGPNAVRRLVKAIGSGEHLDGFIMVTGSIAWESARRFRRKFQTKGKSK